MATEIKVPDPGRKRHVGHRRALDEARRRGGRRGRTAGGAGNRQGHGGGERAGGRRADLDQRAGGQRGAGRRAARLLEERASRPQTGTGRRNRAPRHRAGAAPAQPIRRPACNPPPRAARARSRARPRRRPTSRPHAPLPAAAKLIEEQHLSRRADRRGQRQGRPHHQGRRAGVPRPARRAARAGCPLPSRRATDEPREERVRMTRLRRTIAARLKEAQNTAAMLTTFNEVDMSAVMALRNEYRDAFEKKHGGVRLGFMSFFVQACCRRAEGVPGGQRRDRRRRHRLQELRPHGHRGRRSERAGGAGDPRRRRA